MKNNNLHSAKKQKNDEFYTNISDIEKELNNYRGHFKNKIVFCNCDDPEDSHFWKYFVLNFERLQLKKLIATHFDFKKQTYKLEMTKIDKVKKTILKENGDFRSPECIEILKEVDIVVTNPPFSLFREYVAQLIEYKKGFIIIGSLNAITYKETFKLIKGGQIWLGNNYVKEFRQPDESIKKFGNICWFTNLEHSKRNEELILYKKYNEADYPKYDNYDAINVNKVIHIPCDYYDAIGVPITFLDKYNSEQFEILGGSDRGGDNMSEVEAIRLTIKKKDSCLIKGKKIYKRLFIKRK